MDRDSYLARYHAEHRHPVNRACHAIGIPLIVGAFPLAVWHWRGALVAFVLGWVFQLAGHRAEGNRPAFLGGRAVQARFEPLYLLVGPWWLAQEAVQGIFSRRR